MRIGLSAGITKIYSRATAGVVSLWILATGSWNDNQYWQDTENWKDS